MNLSFDSLLVVIVIATSEKESAKFLSNHLRPTPSIVTVRAKHTVDRSIPQPGGLHG